MPVARGRLVLSGALASNRDFWTIGFSTNQPAALSEAQRATWTQSAVQAFESNFWTPSKGLYTTATDYRTGTWYGYGIDGLLNSQNTYSLSAPNAGTGVASGQPPQSAHVCTLATAQPGRSGRGRIYLPGLAGGQLTVDGMLPDATALTLAQRIRAFIVAVNALQPEIKVQVHSETKQALYAVTQVRVGNIVDTQRRRRDALTETYQTVAV